MLGLQLRQEFKNRVLKGTAIDFNNEVGKNAEDFLEITYPSNDLLKSIEAIGPNQSRPVVMIGERGQGKSHLMTALYHTFVDPDATKAWLYKWANQLNRPELDKLPLRTGMHVIAESLQRQNYKFLWELLLERHPMGQYIRGKWEGQGDKKTDVLSYDLVLEMVKNQPTAIILDEFQTWYDALTNTKQYPWKNWAFNFIQILSEIAKEHPELLVLVVSVRNGNSDAYQQIHRMDPALIDFKGEYAKRDRKRLLLHRLFENRAQVSDNDIIQFIEVHVKEYFRLLQIPESEHENIRQEFLEAWPYAPHLLQLLEDQVLIATDAQETRDLIKILANLYKEHSSDSKLITAASFSISDDRGGVTALLASVTNEYHATLREKAQRNLQAVSEAVKDVNTKLPHVANIISALWLRSLSIDKMAGAERSMLQVDITQDKAIDDNYFLIEMNTIVDNSFNIHEAGSKLVFRQEENPQAKLMSYARNDRIFQDRSDIDQLAKEIRYLIGGQEDVANKYRIIVLKRNWLNNPWIDIEDNEQPNRWDNRIPIVVIPEVQDKMNEVLGKWLSQHIPTKRNTIRFLLPSQGLGNIYTDPDLIILARAVLKAAEWKKSEPDYNSLHQKYQKELRSRLNTLFDRFAILNVWNYSDPKQCEFHIEPHQAQGKDIPEAIDQFIRNSIFIPEDFTDIVMEMAQNNDAVTRLLTELQEPRPGGEECIPWLGETDVKEKLIRLCAKGKIAIDLRGMDKLIVKTGESEEEAWHRMKGKMGTGSHLNQTYIMVPSTIPSSSFVNVQDETQPTKTQSTELNGGSRPDVGSSGGLTPSEYIGGNHNSSIFDGRSAINFQRYQVGSTSSLNLLGKVEEWGIRPTASVRNVNIRIDNLNGGQLQKLLKSLPDGVTYGLDLEKEES